MDRENSTRYDKPVRRLSAQDALELVKKEAPEALFAMAHEKRTAVLSSDRATYVIMRIVSYTNICVADCAYCAFYRKPGDPQGYILREEEIFEKIGALLEKGGSLVAMEGGFHPALKADHYEKLFRGVRKRYGEKIEIYGPTAVEVLFIARNSRIPVEECLKRLWEAGLHWIPGGGAEILTPEWRRRLSPKKYSVEQYLQTVEAAQRLGFGTTATMVIGFGENWEARIEHLQRIRELQDKTGGFASFLLWTYQSPNTRWGGPVTSNEDYLKTVALSRLFLDNIPHIRSSFLTQGLGGARALQAGADDFDIPLEDQVTQEAGITIEENVEKFLTAVAALGMTPVKRQPWRIHEFAGRK